MSQSAGTCSPDCIVSIITPDRDINNTEVNFNNYLMSIQWIQGDNTSCSRAPAAKGRHAEPHTYSTHAFIFVWSSLPAVNGSQAHTYDDDIAQHGAHIGQLMHCIHLCNWILEIHFIIN